MRTRSTAPPAPPAPSRPVKPFTPFVRPWAAMVPLVLLLAGCASPSGGAEPLEETSLDETWNIASRGGRELNFEMREGGRVSWVVNASAEVAYDLHSHAEDRTTQYHEQGRGRLWNGTFTAPADDVYSIFVSGTGATSIVRVHVEGAFAVKG